MPQVHTDASSRVGVLEVGGRSHYVTHGRRLTIGSSRTCDIVVDGPGIAAKHARLSLRLDGRLLVKPLSGQSVRIGGRRHSSGIAVDPGEQIGLGLITMATGGADMNLAVHFVQVRRDLEATCRVAARRAPWFLISVISHAVILMVLLLLLDRREPADGDGREVTLGMETVGRVSEAEEADREQEAEIALPEVEELEMPEREQVADFRKEEQAGLELAGVGPTGDFADRSGVLAGDLTRGLGQKKATALPRGASEEFKETVATLRRSGLEVAFLFDSTASMGRLLADAKQDLLRLYLLLEELVPSTRMALLTYRDRGDAYLTRATKLGATHYEALAFLSAIRAEGGGDFEEAVDQALDDAKRLPWKARARKIVVLIGDAPPHRRKQRACEATAGWFARRSGEVHCLVAGNDAKTWAAFRKIASAGGGRALAREESSELAQQLLLFAFGPDSGKDLQMLLYEQGQRFERRYDGPRSSLPAPGILAATLARSEPDPVIVEAWTWAQPADLRELATPLAAKRLSPDGLQALYYVINRSLEREGPWHTPLIPEPRSSMAKGLPDDLAQRLRGLGRRR